MAGGLFALPKMHKITQNSLLKKHGIFYLTFSKYIRTQAYLTVIPGLAIMVVVYALNVVGDGLRDCLDPRLKK